ncbi:FtsQ-type POTRA domain-containing protein [Anaplasmataceae bacterium AB001_6]|nr:FtsQ-type POTRA domain-containing protein [Anaplasmataceae bacterium AB001_6]
MFKNSIKLCEKYAVNRGLIVKNFNINGSKLLNDNFIKNIENKLLANNMISVDLHDLSNDFFKNAWVKNVKIRKIYPESISVDVEEYVPFALWNGISIIDIFGNVIIDNIAEANHDIINDTLDTNSLISLYMDANDNNLDHFIDLVNYIKDCYPEFFAKLKQVRQSRSMKWEIRLSDGTLLKIPGNHYDSAFAKIKSIIHSNSYLSNYNKEKPPLIDARIPSKTYFKQQ